MKISLPLCCMCALFDSVYASNLLRGSNQNKVQQKYATSKVFGSSAFQYDNMKDNVDVFIKQRKTSSHASSGFDTDNPHNISSSVIKNGVPWVDQNGNIMEIGRGGKISVIDGVYYWIGHQPAPPKLWSEAGDVYLYKSTSFGSNSWEFVRILYDFSLEEGSVSNCALSKYPSGSVEKYFIHCSLGVLFETFDGQPLESTEFVRQSKLNDPASLPYRDYKWANCDTHVDGENLYFVVSRRSKTGDTVNSRVGMIYKFDSTWHSLTEVVAVWSWIGREAYDMIKNGEYFYLFASQTARWRQSRTFFLRSPTMEGFANATEEELVMNPIWTNEIQSMGSQFRTIVEVENGKWIWRKQAILMKILFAVLGGGAECILCESTGTQMLSNLSGTLYATFSYEIECDGNYHLHISYLSTENRYLYLSVNDGISQIFHFGASGGSCAESGLSIVRTVVLGGFVRGQNTIKIQNPTGEFSPMIEWISLVPEYCDQACSVLDRKMCNDAILCTWSGKNKVCISTNNPPPTPPSPTPLTPAPTSALTPEGQGCSSISNSKICKNTNNCSWSRGQCI
ncbi:predicted protein [Chaetoceros tenuissimus]|uniref:Uncharacterized protein n=1 Tax=Chaetoceros tenuissimus TaxID=426638 RepID=A0AAD3CMX5_9STRA|nr:predicted protein [Chaetoceros tenuissimus]